jgi:hypothetical protein
MSTMARRNLGTEEPKGRGGPVQFRPGPFLDGRLKRLASDWETSSNEAARRLALLASCELTCGQYFLVSMLASALGRSDDFGSACERIWIAIRVANQTRDDMKMPPLDEQGRQKVLQG